jgi:hypothetical protein
LNTSVKGDIINPMGQMGCSRHSVWPSCSGRAETMKTKEEQKEYQHEYYVKNKSRIAESRDKQKTHNYYIENMELVAEHGKKYYDGHIDEILKKKKEYRRSNPEVAEAYRERNKEKLAAKNREYVVGGYGIGLEEYNEILFRQNGKCAICGAEPSNKNLYIDHNHETGKVRGLLCPRCNFGLGHFKDSSVLLKSAIDYLSANVFIEEVK